MNESKQDTRKRKYIAAEIGASRHGTSSTTSSGRDGASRDGASRDGTSSTEMERKRASSRKSSQRHRYKEKFAIEDTQKEKESLTQINGTLKIENRALREQIRMVKLHQTNSKKAGGGQQALPRAAGVARSDSSDPGLLSAGSTASATSRSLTPRLSLAGFPGLAAPSAAPTWATSLRLQEAAAPSLLAASQHRRLSLLVVEQQRRLLVGRSTGFRPLGRLQLGNEDRTFNSSGLERMLLLRQLQDRQVAPPLAGRDFPLRNSIGALPAAGQIGGQNRQLLPHPSYGAPSRPPLVSSLVPTHHINLLLSQRTLGVPRAATRAATIVMPAVSSPASSAARELSTPQLMTIYQQSIRNGGKSSSHGSRVG